MRPKRHAKTPARTGRTPVCSPTVHQRSHPTPAGVFEGLRPKGSTRIAQNGCASLNPNRLSVTEIITPVQNTKSLTTASFRSMVASVESQSAESTQEGSQTAELLSALNRVFEEDCLTCMSRIPDSSVDLILCDLPYGVTQNNWDCDIPLDELWKQYKRILKRSGAVVLTSQGIFTAKLIMSNPDWFKYKLIWVKSKAGNFLNAKKQPLRKHEEICVFYPKQPTYNPQMVQGEPYDKGIRKDQLTGSYGDFQPVHVKSDGLRYPSDVLYFKTAESEGEVYHPTQKPVSLGRYLVRTYSNPGDVVLDNTCGSGSFIVAALLEGRNFIGIEKNENVALFKKGEVNYIEVCRERLRRAWESLPLSQRSEVSICNLVAELDSEESELCLQS